MPMHMVEFLKHISTALLLLTGLCFFYQTVYLVISLFWREPKHKPEKGFSLFRAAIFHFYAFSSSGSASGSCSRAA